MFTSVHDGGWWGLAVKHQPGREERRKLAKVKATGYLKRFTSLNDNDDILLGPQRISASLCVGVTLVQESDSASISC